MALCVNPTAVEESLAKLTKEHFELRQFFEIQQATLNSLTNNNYLLANSCVINSPEVKDSDVQNGMLVDERIPQPVPNFQPVRRGGVRLVH